MNKQGLTPTLFYLLQQPEQARTFFITTSWRGSQSSGGFNDKDVMLAIYGFLQKRLITPGQRTTMFLVLRFPDGYHSICESAKVP